MKKYNPVRYISKTILLIMIAVLANISSLYAQLSATIIPPPRIIISSQQLIQLQVRNTGTPTTAIIKMILRKDNEQMYSCEYHDVKVVQGIQILNLGQMTPAIKEYGASEASGILSTTGKLVFGEYTLCIFIGQGSLPQGPPEICINFDVKPSTPPILLSPADKSIVPTTHPLLTWLPPTPMVPGINYTLKLTLMDSGQSATDALMRNPILFGAEKLEYNSKIYPTTATALIPGQRYAWQIEAFWAEYPLGITDVWEFQVKEPEKKKKDTTYTSYYQAKTIRDGTYCTAEPVLKVLIPNIKSVQKTKFNITDAEGKEVKLNSKSKSKLELKPGDNFFAFDMTELASLENNKFYTMHLNTDNGKYYIAFQFFSTEKDKSKKQKH